MVGRCNAILASEESFTISGARLAMHLMAQPQIVAKWYGDRALADQGFLARFLTCAPQSLGGTRKWTSTDQWAHASIASYQYAIADLLRLEPERDDVGAVRRGVMQLSQEAFELHRCGGRGAAGSGGRP
jgi:Protein of unknown function (DUF3987)